MKPFLFSLSTVPFPSTSTSSRRRLKSHVYMLLLWCLWQFYNWRFNPHDLTVWIGMAFNRRDVLLRYWRYVTWATFLVHLPRHFAALFRNCRRAPLHFFLGPSYLRFSLAIIPDHLLGLRLLTFLCSGWTRNSYDIDQSSLYRLLAFVLSTLAIGDCQASMLNRTWCGVSNSVNCTSSLSINSTSDCCCSFAGFDLSDCYPFETFAFPFSKASLMPCEMERMAPLSPPAITSLPTHILLFIFLFSSLFISSSSYFLSFLSHGFFLPRLWVWVRLFFWTIIYIDFTYHYHFFDRDMSGWGLELCYW